MKILVFNRHFLPGFRAGGPIKSLANMIEALGLNYKFYLVTTDRDLLEAHPYPDIQYGTWMTVGKAQVRYLKKEEISLKVLRVIVSEIAPDRIYLNSFFDPIFSLRIFMLNQMKLLSHIPLVVAPRGEFSRGALLIKKQKKKAYLKLFKSFGVLKRIVWHASTSLEASDITRTFDIDPKQVRTAIDLATPFWKGGGADLQTRSKKSKFQICFVSRISPMKNLLGALQVLSTIKHDISFDIYGPKEDMEYWSACSSYIDTIPENVKISYCGILSPDMVVDTIGKYDLFFLPTRGENFGHVIVEALSAGVPVLISDQTPWRDVQECQVGWIVNGSKFDYAEAIRRCAAAAPDERISQKIRCFEYAQRVSTNQSAIEQNMSLFR